MKSICAFYGSLWKKIGKSIFANTSLRNSSTPWCDALDKTLTATTTPFVRMPLYTMPKPPLPRIVVKLFVAIWMSSKLNLCATFVASSTFVWLTTTQDMKEKLAHFKN